MGWMDRLSPAVRHGIFAFGSIIALAILDGVQKHYSEWGLDPVVTGVIAAAIPLAIAYLTPLTRQYGVGSSVQPAPTGAAQDEVNA